MHTQDPKLSYKVPIIHRIIQEYYNTLFLQNRNYGYVKMFGHFSLPQCRNTMYFPLFLGVLANNTFYNVKNAISGKMFMLKIPRKKKLLHNFVSVP